MEPQDVIWAMFEDCGLLLQNRAQGTSYTANRLSQPMQNMLIWCASVQDVRIITISVYLMEKYPHS